MRAVSEPNHHHVTLNKNNAIHTRYKQALGFALGRAATIALVAPFTSIFRRSTKYSAATVPQAAPPLSQQTKTLRPSFSCAEMKRTAGTTNG